jgi:hypothetical protein
VKRFGMKGKLAPCYIRPFPILEKCGTVAYKLDLSPSLAGVHDILNVPQLKKCLKAHVDVVLPEVTPLEADLLYPEHSIIVLDHKDRVTRHKIIKFFKIQWSNHSEEEATWESEDFLHSCHSEELCNCSLRLLEPLLLPNLGMRFLVGGRAVTPLVSVRAAYSIHPGSTKMYKDLKTRYWWCGMK